MTDPLISGQPIVNEDGTPTDYFLRQWGVQRVGNVTLEEQVAALQVLAAAQGIQITALQAADIILQAQIDGIQDIDLIAGVGLDGGGDLSGPDRTFDLADTAVTPGSYTGTDLTVDQQGRITAAANGSGGGGGGNSFAWPIEIDSAFSGSSFAFKGAHVKLIEDINISVVTAFIATTAGYSYKAGVYRLDGSDNIDEITGVSAVIASPGTFGSGVVVRFPLTSAAAMTAGNVYAILVGRTDGATNFALPMSVEAVVAELLLYPNVPAEPYVLSTTLAITLAQSVTTNPAISTAVDLFASANTYGVGFKFSM